MGSFTREYQIDQMTPLIHFQYDDPGATVRATELKPKLDRFLCERYREAHGESVPKAWRIEGAPGNDGRSDYYHLNYKAQVFPKGKTEIIKIERNNFPMYFANMGDGAKKHGVFCPEGLTLKVTCLIANKTQREALLVFLSDNLDLFFLTHNFGTRQTKGYGGFLCRSEKTVEQYLEMLSRSYPSFIYFRYKNQPGKNLADDVDLVCMAMKTGRNRSSKREIERGIEDNYVKGYLMTYSGLEGGNDKAWMKCAFGVGLSRGGGRPGPLQPGMTYHFKRALLGLTDNYLFRQVNGGEGKALISVRHKKGRINRFPSPVLVKVIPGAVCFLPKDVDPILDEEFEFQYRGQKKVISTPKQFDTAQFLEKFAKWYNGKEYAKTPNDTFIQGSLRDRCSKITLEVSKP